jgi:hypothetical protein
MNSKSCQLYYFFFFACPKEKEAKRKGSRTFVPLSAEFPALLTKS